MNPTGVQYFTHSDKTNTSGQLQVFYAFTGGSGTHIIPSLPFGKSAYSGFIDNTGSFYDVSGSGFFGGQTSIRVNNASGLSSQTWSMIIDYKISGGQNNVLFSNYSSGTINSGWIIGVNDANSVYLEYYSNQGPQILISNTTYGTQNTIVITKNNSAINLDYLDYNTKSLISENFSIDPVYFLPSDNWYIGASTGTPGYYSGQKYKGFMDYWLYFAPALLPSQKLGVLSGLYCDITNPIQTISSYTTSLVTGQTTGLVSIFTGTTGEANEFYNYITGACNSIHAVYSGINLTGFVYDIGTVPLTQTITTYITGITGGGPIENSGYSISHGFNAVSYLKEINATDISELYYFPRSTNKININNELSFDFTLNKFILPSQYNINQINFYINSVGQFGSGYNVTGDFYNLTIDKSGMYFVSGNYLSGDYQGNDTNIIDIISGNRVFNTGFWVLNNNTGISGMGLPNSLVFLGGQKLKSGLDYRISGTDLILNNSYWYDTIDSGRYWSAPIDTESSFTSGVWNNLDLNSGYFARGTTQLWMNGVRENLNDDYIEISHLSLLNNSGHYLDNLNNIFISDLGFLESI
jgi:hypothetical protein